MIDVIRSNIWAIWWNPVKWPSALFRCLEDQKWLVLFVLTFEPVDENP